MPKVYITRKKLNEDVSITDATLAQQYLAVKKQMADKRTKRDQLMKNVNQIDNEMNILEKNLIAIEMKSTQQTGEVKATQPENREQPAVQGGTNQGEIVESLSLNEELSGEENDYREEVIDYISNIEEYPDAETIVWEFGDILDNCYLDDQPVETCAKTIIQAARSASESISYDFDEDDDLDEDGFIGGDTQGKAQVQRTRILKVKEEMFNTHTASIDKYDKNSVYMVKGQEKIVDEVEKYSNGAIITFRDGTEYSAEELDSLNAKFVRALTWDEIDELDRHWDDEFDAEFYEDEDEETIQELQQQLSELEEEEQQIRTDMEQELANYDESSWVPDKNPRKSLSTGETSTQQMPHDVYGEALQNVEDKQEEIRKLIRELSGAGPISEDMAEYGNSNMGPTNVEDDEDIYKVEESVYDDIIDKLESERNKMEQIQDFIVDLTDNIEIDINMPDDVEVNVEEPTQVLEPEEEPEVLMPIPVEDEEEDVPAFDMVQYNNDEEPYDQDNSYEDEDEDPFMPSGEDLLVSQTLKAEEDKGPYEPMMEDGELETEIEMMNYEDDDQERDEYVFHVKIDETTDHEIIAKIFRDDEEDFWTVRVVKGDEEPLQSMEFDPRLDKLEIIAKLADIYDEIEIIHAKEYEFLLDDKEKVDSEYYEDLK